MATTTFVNDITVTDEAWFNDVDALTYQGIFPSGLTSVVPDATDGASLGTSSVMWSDLFLASGSVVNFDNGDVTVTHTANALTVAGGTWATAALTATTITGSGILSIDDVTDTTSTITGSIHTDGGLGIAKALWVGTTSRLVGAITADATATFAGVVDLDGNIMAIEAGAGITGGTGTIYKSSVVTVGGVITTTILLDLTDLQSSTTDLDIIGQSTTAAHIGQITAARNGTILTGRVECLEAPVTGVTDIDVYHATEATGVFDDAIGGLTSTVALTSGGAWALGTVKYFTGMPAANSYLYLTNGGAGVVGTYSAGKFLITLQGY